MGVKVVNRQQVLPVPTVTYRHVNTVRAYRPGCCIDAEPLFMGEATRRNIFCLQETLRGVRGVAAFTLSLLQPDRVLFLPSPLLGKGGGGGGEGKGGGSERKRDGGEEGGREDRKVTATDAWLCHLVIFH